MIMIASFEKNKIETVKVHLSEYKGSKVIDIRIWNMFGDKEYITRKGLTIRTELLPKLKEAILAVEKALRI